MTAFARASLLLIVLFVWGALSALAGVPRVAIRNPGRLGSAPADWWIVVTVDPQPEHRWLVVEVDGQPGEYRRSDIALEGEKAARIRQLWFKALPAGCYWFRASVSEASKVLASVSSGPVSIIGLDGNLCPE